MILCWARLTIYLKTLKDNVLKSCSNVLCSIRGFVDYCQFSAGQKPSRPIRGQFFGHVITLDQAETSNQKSVWNSELKLHGTQKIIFMSSFFWEKKLFWRAKKFNKIPQKTTQKITLRFFLICRGPFVPFFIK